ncbi:hypothetical protein TNCV_1755911 [Trichonephila clavipes]|nr:hypothetical protein TNCV_1755911 [Trichonephila clavipes]
MSSSLVLLKNCRVESDARLIYREIKHPPVGVVWMLEEGKVPAQVSSSSLDHGSELGALVSGVAENTRPPSKSGLGPKSQILQWIAELYSIGVRQTLCCRGVRYDSGTG